MAKASVDEMIAALYAAFYERAPELDGLRYWEGQHLDADRADSFVQIAVAFAQHPDFSRRYGSLDDRAFVEAIYRNVSGYDGDEEGIEYWTEQLSKMHESTERPEVAAKMIYGFMNAELDHEHFPDLSQEELTTAEKRQKAVTNIADAGLYYVERLGEATNFSQDTDLQDPLALEKDPAWQKAEEAIAGVTDDPRTLSAAQERIDLEAGENTGGDGGADHQDFSRVNDGIDPLLTADDTRVLALASMALEEGDSWHKKTISYTFNESLPQAYADAGIDTTGWRPLNAEEKAMVRKNFEALDDFLAVHFVEKEGGDIAYNVVEIEENGTSGYTMFPYNNTVYPYDVVDGDVFLDREFDRYGIAPGSDGYATIEHETGHALGLKHPFEGKYLLESDLDDIEHTVMTYDSSMVMVPRLEEKADGVELSFAPLAEPASYMPLDIAALQAIYGPNMEAHKGDDLYELSDLYQNRQRVVLWDAGGEDTLDLSKTTHPDKIDLRPGSLSDVAVHTIEEIANELASTLRNPEGYHDWIVQQLQSSQQQGMLFTGREDLGLAFGTVIENVKTGSGDDTVYDNIYDNRIETGAGDDRIHLSGGADFVDGGEGNDTLYLPCRESETEIKRGDDSWIVEAEEAGIYVELIGVETVQFSDSALSLS